MKIDFRGMILIVLAAFFLIAGIVTIIGDLLF